MSEPRSALSLSRVLVVVLPVALVGGGLYWWSTTLESKAREEMSANVFCADSQRQRGGDGAAMGFADKDGDLVADSPEDPAKLHRARGADVLLRGRRSGKRSAGGLAAAACPTGRENRQGSEVRSLRRRPMNSSTRSRRASCTSPALNTGIVPVAVQRDGFVPLCTFGREDGTYGYTMKFLVPADSPIKDLEVSKVTR